MLRDLNVCKSGHCVNLGEPGAPEYEFHIRPLGFLAMRCHRCSSTPPMLDNPSYLQMLNFWQQKLALYTGCCCPDCGDDNFKRFGNSAVQRPRRQCKSCFRTFSVRAPVMTAQRERVETIMRLLKCRDEGQTMANYAAEQGVHFDRASGQLSHFALSALWQRQRARLVATTIFTVPYKGKNNALWCLLSSNMETGEVLHISSTLIEVGLPEAGRYQPCLDAPKPNWNEETSAISRAEEQESRFLHRAQFDRCDFGLAQVTKKGTYHALPVLTAHAHFSLLNRLGHATGQGEDVGTHCLQHEVFLRGACITQYAQCVKRHRMALLYVVGETRTSCVHQGTRKLGWWQNHWEWVTDTEGKQKAYSVLCGNNRLQTEQISLATAQAAVAYIQRQVAYHKIDDFTPSRVNHLLSAMAMSFNESLF